MYWNEIWLHFRYRFSVAVQVWDVQCFPVQVLTHMHAKEMVVNVRDVNSKGMSNFGMSNSGMKAPRAREWKPSHKGFQAQTAIQKPSVWVLTEYYWYTVLQFRNVQKPNLGESKATHLQGTSKAFWIPKPNTEQCEKELVKGDIAECVCSFNAVTLICNYFGFQSGFWFAKAINLWTTSGLPNTSFSFKLNLKFWFWFLKSVSAKCTKLPFV